jgi:ribosomal protein L20
MTTLIIIINHQIGEADKLTKADISKLWFHGISRIVAQNGLTFEQMIPEIEKYEAEC